MKRKTTLLMIGMRNVVSVWINFELLPYDALTIKQFKEKNVNVFLLRHRSVSRICTT